jgi:hypothetical protein
MSSRCPLAGYSIDPNMARVQAALTMILASFGLAVQNPTRVWIALVLLVDVLPRAVSRPEASLSTHLARPLLAILDLRNRKVDAGPKRFAARITACFAIGIAVLSGLGHTIPALGLTGVLMFFSTLEATLGFCVACALYQTWFSIFGRDPDPDQF